MTAGVQPRPRGRKGFAVLLLLLVTVGVCSRAAPLLDHGGRLFQQFPTEDGYLMLTIARNIALGRGMSIAEGEIPTNGTQPLATFLWAACFAATDGDRTAGVRLVLALEILISCGAALLLWRLGKQVLREHPSGAQISALAAAVWFASPVVMRHTMNGLESGLYIAIVLLVLLVVGRGPAPGKSRPQLARWGGIGLLLGVAFLARNDAILLCLAVGTAHLFGALPQWRCSWTQRIAELTSAASAAAVVAAPWLIHNVVGFGHIVPISGQSEKMHVGLAANLWLVPPSLAEYFSLILPLPESVEKNPIVIAACTLLAVVALLIVLKRAREWPTERRALVAIGSIYSLGLCVFYGVLFGAGYFMSRYLFPTSVFLALLWAGTAWTLLTSPRRFSGALQLGASAAVLALVVGTNARLYLRGDQHEHFQVVNWVNENVPAHVWIGAVQTGTLGFFHERTVNLDGKVNPMALEARMQRRIPQYVLKEDLQYLVDWVGIAEWGEYPELKGHFEVLVDDPQKNLAVLGRRDS